MLAWTFIFSILTLSLFCKITIAKNRNNPKFKLNHPCVYTHSIKKREAVNWCSAQDCTTCVGNTCQMTCRGSLCVNCPNGNCCNGEDCNACSNGICCSTPSCNFCLSACNHLCEDSILCTGTCAPQCYNTPYEVFVLPSKTYNNDSQQVVTVFVRGVPYSGAVTAGLVDNSTKTALVTVDGFDSKAMVLWVNPSTCQSGRCNSHCNNQFNDSNSKEALTHHNHLPQGCCHVVHPTQCYNNHIYPYQHCFRRSHIECSSLCSSQFVHFTPNLDPRSNRLSQCHYINTYPFVYCGQYSKQNCDSCYVCNSQYNPHGCMQQNSCSNACKQSFVPPDMSRMQHVPPDLPWQQAFPHYNSHYALQPQGLQHPQVRGYLQNPQGRVDGGNPWQYG